MKTTKIISVLCAALSISFSGFAQEGEEALTANVFRINFLSRLGWSYEIKTASRQTLYLQTSIAPRLNINIENRRLLTNDFFISPGLSSQYRFYYNLQKRADQGRRIQLNSGDFLGPAAEIWYSREPVRGSLWRDDYRLLYTFGGVWGLQRNFAGRISLEYHVGPGIRFAQGTDISITGREVRSIAPTLMGGLTFGLWLNKAPQ